MFKKWSRATCIIITAMIIVIMGLGDLSLVFDADARGRSGFSSSRSSSSFRSSSSRSSRSSFSKSFRSSSKRSSKSSSSSFWRSKGSKSKSKVVAKSSKPKRKGFGGTSVFDKKQARAIKTAKVNKAKQQYNKDMGRYKKPVSKVYTKKTIPNNIKSNPIFSKTKVKSTANYSTYCRQRDNYYRNTGWTAPTYVYNTSPSFGMWDSMMLWMMLDNMNDKKYANMAYNHSNDPGFQEWRKEAEKMAADNAELKAKLDAMDSKLSTMTGPKDDSYLPEGMPSTVALAPAVLAAANKEKVVFNIATGGKKGNYYKSGNILANKVKDTIDVKVNATAGTMENIKLFIDGKVDGMIGQTDGVDIYALTNPNLVSKMKAKWIPLYKEPIQMIANVKGGVKSIKDLDEKTTLFIGPKGSGTSLTWKRIVRSNPKRYSKIKVKNASYTDALNMVIDFPSAVMMYVSGLNSSFMRSVEVLADTKGLRLVEINDRKLGQAVDTDGNKLYTFVEIPSRVYPKLQKGWFGGNDVKSIAVTAAFIINDSWVTKYGQEALDDLTAGVVAMQPIMSTLVNGDLE